MLAHSRVATGADAAPPGSAFSLMRSTTEPTGAVPPLADGATFTEAVVQLTVNAQAEALTLIVLRDPAGALWLAEQDMMALRLRIPDGRAVERDGRRYLPLAAIAGSQARIDEAALRVTVTVPAAAFVSERFSAGAQGPQPLTRTAPGAFLNYQLSSQRVLRDVRDGAFAELGMFAGPGVLTSTAVAVSDGGTRRVERLETSFTHDDPARLLTLVVGDAISDGASWGNAVRYAGLRFGRNFALRPDLVTLPTLSASGTAVVPSTVDVFVNNQRVSSQDVAPGSFIIDRLPAMTGSGEMRVVVRDALGREQVVTQSFYASNRLLARGISQYSLSMGRIRRNYAQPGDGYGDWLASGSYKRAVGDALTLEGHLETLQHDATAAGANAAIALGRFGVLNLTAATGGRGGEHGWLTGAGFERVGRRLSFTLATTAVQVGFHQIGEATLGGERFRQRGVAQVGVNLHRAGSLALAYAQQLYRRSEPLRTFSATYSLVMWNRAAANLTVTRGLGSQPSTSAYLSFTLALSPRRSASLQAAGSDTPGAPPTEIYAQAQQNPPLGTGYGYRLGAGSRGSYDAAWRAQTGIGDLELQAVRTAGVTAQSALWSGAATLLGGEVRAVRSVNGSFALIDVGGLPDVPVYVDHQLVTRTDGRGLALLHDLRPYEANRINVEPLELPLDTRIGARTVVLAPAYRSGVVARFPVERERGVTFRILGDDAKPLPAGAELTVSAQTVPVALDGVAFLPRYEGAAIGVASWSGHRCQFRLPGTGSSDPLPDLGAVRCQAGAP
jgi:outer membrane usher protein